jgi:hypothetical protein
MFRRTRAALGIIILAAVGATTACGEELRPVPRRVTGPSIIQPVNITFTGMVRNETGSAIENALVGVQSYDWYEDDYVWQTTRTDATGRYQLIASIWYPEEGHVAKASLEGDEYEPTLQVMALTATEGFRDFRLRRVRQTTSEEPVTVSLDAESGLCTELGRGFSAETRCETVRITAAYRGLLTVDVRPATDGGRIPVVGLDDFWSALPGRASAYVVAGQTCKVRVQVPLGTPGPYVVSTFIQQ